MGDKRQPENVNKIIQNILKSAAVKEDIVKKCIAVQLADFNQTTNTEQNPNTFSIVEATNTDKSILTVKWTFSVTDMIYFNFFYIGGKNKRINFEYQKT